MDIEKTLLVAASPAHIWSLLLDPHVMGACVPGMQSVEVISDVEYLSHIQVKIAFITAKFKIKTTIVEQRAPHYLRSEGTGEDASVASSLKQASEIFLTEQHDGRTELRINIKVDVMGRLGTFGLSVMKTKADRMWEEFCAKLVAQLDPTSVAGTAPTAVTTTSAVPALGAAASNLPVGTTVGVPAPAPTATATGSTPAPALQRNAFNTAPQGPATQIHALGAWAQFCIWLGGSGIQRDPNDIVIELRRSDTLLTVRWPQQSAQACAAWLQDYVRQTA